VAPHTVAVLQGRVEAAEEHQEAGAYPAAEQKALRLVDAIDLSLIAPRTGNTRLRRFAPAGQLKRPPKWRRAKPAQRSENEEIGACGRYRP
jgi:hypothetical protein